MREVVISNCEKNFLQNIVSEGHRLDGRNYNESRKLEISFGSDYGSCSVSLGETKVFAQVSCEIVQPKQIRPNEGILFINLDITPMAAPQFEAYRPTDLNVYLNRLLEKCYKDSKCIDLESLCIVVEEKVWSLRVDLKVLNHAGNLIECSSIATLTSLAHFKRPDITRSGESVIIHSLIEKDPIPTVLYHYPVCVTYVIFGTEILLSDPTFIEESVCMSSTEDGINTAGGMLVVGMNQYKELCLLDLTGAAIDNSNIITKAINNAAERCKEVVDVVKKAIINDDTLRRKRIKINMGDTITNEHIQSMSKKDLSICLKRYNVDDIKKENEDIEMAEKENEEPELSKYNVVPSKPYTAEIIAKKAASTWIEVSSESECEEI
ncbi:exosome complex component RRP45 [Epargyreus clarus]|uniref:exosome complex component RRP45 n=1 Tax=Epargyreus clarus TaxID=520877 RepID=UPI003C2F0C15